jgi:hypothetical protein
MMWIKTQTLIYNLIQLTEISKLNKKKKIPIIEARTNTYSDSQNRIRERDICIHKAIAQAWVKKK